MRGIALLTCEAVLAETAFHLQNASLVLAMLNDGLATSADRFATELRGEAQLEQRKVEPEAPIHVPVPARPKRKPASRKTSSAQTPLPHAAVIDEVRH